MATMKAVVKTKPELGAEMQDKPIPKRKSDWVIVKVRATSICATDMHIYKWGPLVRQADGPSVRALVAGPPRLRRGPWFESTVRPTRRMRN